VSRTYRLTEQDKTDLMHIVMTYQMLVAGAPRGVRGAPYAAMGVLGIGPPDDGPIVVWEGYEPLANYIADWRRYLKAYAEQAGRGQP
jgi:hypothetical protein